ncbi:MAG: RICIN domain-containing protein [Hahellaceae bacterium]|nr:RICIN domain-containing protein [Hahellaceae bacterium]
MMMFRAPLNTRRFSLLRSGLNLGFSLVCLAFTSNSHAITVGTYEISAEHSGKCLDVTEWSTQNGTGLQQWSCDSGANQRFELESQGNGFYRIRSVHSGKCVDVAERSNNNGALIQQWDCHSGSNQNSSSNYSVARRHRPNLKPSGRKILRAFLPDHVGSTALTRK